MLRNLVRFFLLILVFAALRYLVGLFSKAFTTVARSERKAESPQPATSSGELKRDPVCGTFVAVGSSIKRTVNGEVIHFCSSDCRDKYLVAKA
jgi:YHS domain-containing protein